MEAGDPPVHRQGPGPLAAPWGEADAVFAARPGVLSSPNPTANLAGVTERIKVSIGMLRRISVVLISALLMMGFTTSVAWADQPPNKGQGGATEDKRTGAPTTPMASARSPPSSARRLAASVVTPPGSPRPGPGRRPGAAPGRGQRLAHRRRAGRHTRGQHRASPGDHAGRIDGGAMASRPLTPSVIPASPSNRVRPFCPAR